MDGELKAALETLQRAFDALEIDFFIIGAVARDIWYAESSLTSPRTKDIDFAIFAGNLEEYEAVKQYLQDKEGYHKSKGNAFVLITPRGIPVDILPFGGIESDGEVQIEGKGLSSIRVDGMLEVFEAGTNPVTTPGGREFQVASLPAIVLLKLVAFDDRPEKRLKDPRDIANILVNYFSLQSNLIYDHHADLFEVGEAEMEEITLEEIGATVLGREIRKIVHGNPQLLQRVRAILAGLQAEKEDGEFVREMMRETGRPASEVIGWLAKMDEGLQ